MLASKWPTSQRIFKGADIQKLIGKLASLGKGVPWIYKIMSHIYTSLAFALKQNKELLTNCSPKFQDLLATIEKKHFNGRQSNIAKELNFALKTTAKIVNGHKQVYVINETMQAELDFIRQALQEDSGIDFKVPIGLVIPRMPTTSLYGDSSLRAWGR